MEWLQALQQPFPEEWRRILERDVGFYRRFDDATRARFEEQVKVFVLTKEFADKDGRDVDDTIKVVIAATACRLSLNLPGEYFTRLKYVTVEPGSFLQDGASVLGTAHPQKVHLSWEAVQQGLRVPDDGDNVGYHEFAHVLASPDGSRAVMPRFCDPALYGRWAVVMDEELRHLRITQQEGFRSLLGSYAATNKTEFFAVAVETFFERPHEMRLHHAKLYELLSDYFQQDPRHLVDEPRVPFRAYELAPPVPAPPQAASRPSVPALEDEPLNEAQRVRVRFEVKRLEGSASPLPPTDGRDPGKRLVDLKDPDGWQAKDYVCAIGGVLVVVGAIFVVPWGAGSGKSPAVSEAWWQLVTSGELGWTGPILLVAGIVFLVIGGGMSRDE